MEALLKEFTKYLKANHKPESYYSWDQTPQIYMSSVSMVFPQTKFIIFRSQIQTGVPPWAFPLLKSICFLITRFSEAQSHSRLVSPPFERELHISFTSLIFPTAEPLCSIPGVTFPLQISRTPRPWAHSGLLTPSLIASIAITLDVSQYTSACLT